MRDEDKTKEQLTRELRRLRERIAVLEQDKAAREQTADLLITDVIMPKMNGKELAERLVAANPDLKCLFISGYAADVIAPHGVLDQGVHFMKKPFSVKEMADKVRKALDT